MILSYCSLCEYHQIVEVRKHEQSTCKKENCLSIYTKCLSDEAVKQFLHRNRQRVTKRRDSALEICYETV